MQNGSCFFAGIPPIGKAQAGSGAVRAPTQEEAGAYLMQAEDWRAPLAWTFSAR